MRPHQQKIDPVQRIKDKYNLNELEENLYNKGYQINVIQEELHKQLLRNDIDLTDKLNTLAVGVRLQETLIKKSYTDEENYFLNIQKSEYNNPEIKTYSERFNILFDRYSAVIDKLDKSHSRLTYQAKEDETGGILSNLIANRISNHDQNFIIGIHGLPRSGKSKTGIRIGENITTITAQLTNTNTHLHVDDWVFDKEQYLKRLEQRRKDGTLKGSVIVLEEAGDQLNSQKFWDTDVIGSVNILQQQGYQNTCLIIISQLHHDIVKKARGLVHATLVPWKELNVKSLDVDERQHINFKTMISNWKIDLLDTDVISGKSYPQGIKVALGKVKKLSILMPSQEITKAIDKKDHKFKSKRQKEELRKAVSEKLQSGDMTKILESAKTVLKGKPGRPDYFINTRGGYNTKRIENYFGVGGRIAGRIADKTKELQEEINLKNGDNTKQNKKILEKPQH